MLLDRLEEVEHIPVFLDKVVGGLRVRAGGKYIDATLGAAGHARGILQGSTPDGRLLGLDADREAIRYASKVLEPFGDRVILQATNFRRIRDVAVSAGFGRVDGIVMDLGLSSRQLGAADRGFSFSREGPLDMRMDTTTGWTAAELVNQLAERELADLLWRYGDERHSRRIARAICAERPLVTTRQLATLVERVVRRREKIHPATRTFQALRIAVNDELEALAQALPQALDLLQSGGRLAVISFHSLEDGIVKRFFQSEARDCLCPPEFPVCACDHKASVRVITGKPVRPSDEQISRNPRSRSARLRIVERLAQTSTS